MIRVQLLGHLTIFTPAGELVLPTTKARMLTAYLFWQQGKWVRRDFLRGMLWAEYDEQRAAAYLRQALYYLKKALKDCGYEEDVLESKRDAVRVLVISDIYIDAHIFEKRVNEGLDENTVNIKPLIAATSIYQGSFLDGMDEDWCLVERKRLSDMYVRALRALIMKLSESGFYQAAIPYTYLWLKEDPLDEAAYRALMRLFASLGQPTRAMEQFENCRRILETELGISPSETTINLYRELGLSETGIELKGSVGSNESRGYHKSRSLKKISDDTLRNASFLVVSGEDKALQGDIKEGMSSLKKALSIYEKLGDNEGVARVYLVMGSSLLYTPMEPNPVEALKCIMPALEYYRKEGRSASLCRAIVTAADALWQCGQNATAAALCKEGLEIVKELNDKYSEANLSITLGIVLLTESRAKDAKEFFNRATQTLTCFTEIHDVLRVVLNQGILANVIGHFPTVERFMRETIVLTQMVAPSPRIKQAEFMARGYLAFSLYMQDRQGEIEAILPPTEAQNYDPIKNMTYPLSAFLPDIDTEAALSNVEAWLRVGLRNMVPFYAMIFVHQLVIQLIGIGVDDKAAKWATVGIRLARSIGLTRVEAAFHSRRAVPLARLGRIRGAEVCCRRARELMDEGELWTPAYLAWADGLISKARGDTLEAERLLKESIHLFGEMGCGFSLKQVKKDMEGL